MPTKEQKTILFLLKQIHELHRQGIWKAYGGYMELSSEEIEDLSFSLDDHIRCICNLWEVEDEWLD